MGHAEYLWVQFVDGRTEIIQGPAIVYLDQSIHKEIKVQKALNLTDHEALVVYREEEGSQERSEKESSGPEKKVVRSLVYGPCVYVPKNASEWTHEFSWHGSASHDPEGVARKFRSALKFKKLRICPDQTYYDVEGVRTRDDALVTVKLMIFFRLKDIDLMLKETHDPMADFINAVSSDVIDFVAGKSFEEFKGATEKLNELDVYQQLTLRARNIGYEVTKIIFRGYGAPQRLQKMHDDAIERRTKLALERETEDQEQQLMDMKLDREEEREKRKRQMETDAKAHEREIQKLAHQAEQAEKQAERQAKFEHLARLQKDLGISTDQLASYLLALEQGPPAKLIQITGKESTSANGFVHLPLEEKA